MPEIIVHLEKQICLFVYLPQNDAVLGKFIMEFAEIFAVDAFGDGLIGRPIDGIIFPGFACRVEIRIDLDEEKCFYDFLRDFCLRNKLPMRGPDLAPQT